MDFGWFLTIPGMLITGGVLLLIIALIIFITTSSKKTKEKNPNPNQASMPTPVNDMGGASQPIHDSINNVMSTIDSNVGMNSTPSLDANSSSMPMDSTGLSNDIAIPLENNPVQDPIVSSTPVSNHTSLDPSTMEPQPSLMNPSQINAVPTSVNSTNPVTSFADGGTPSNNVEATPTIDMPVQEVSKVIETPISQNIGVTPISEPSIQNSTGIPVDSTVSVSPVTPSPTIETPQMDSSVQVVETPVVQPIESPTVTQEVSKIEDHSVEQTPAVVPAVSPVSVTPQDTAPIYGGADPSFSTTVEANNHHQIYGGADPLENTQIIPVQQPPVEPVVPVSTVDTPAVVPVEPSNTTVEVVPANQSISNP